MLLLDLNGAPMTWDALNARVQQWYATHARDGAQLPRYGCGRCRESVHGRCTGMGADGPCDCAQRGHVA